MPRKKAAKTIAKKPSKGPTEEELRQYLVEAVDQVERWILTGARDLEILKSTKEAFPTFDPEVLYNAASVKLAQNARLSDELVFGLCIAGSFDLYRMMRTNGDLAGALSALKQIAQLQRNKPQPQPAPEGEPQPC